MAARCLSRVLKTASISSVILYRFRPIDALANSKISPTRGFCTKLPEHKIWELETEVFRGQPPLPAGSPAPEFGLDYEHWLVQVKLPNCEMSRDEIIDYYIKVLAAAVGRLLGTVLVRNALSATCKLMKALYGRRQASRAWYNKIEKYFLKNDFKNCNYEHKLFMKQEEEARMKIYSVSTKHYFAFGALVDEKVATKLRGSPKVLAVDPDSYLDPYNKDYGGEPFINGQPVPYDRKYHASYWFMQEAMYRPPQGDQIDAEIPHDDLIDDEISQDDLIDAEFPYTYTNAKQSTLMLWLSRARTWWNGPSP